jgi:glycosyltransferase involved in cell wall biosynthesis
MKKTILFLPIWGKLNETIPQQQMAAIRAKGENADYGLPGAVFPLTRSAKRFKPEVISVDWIHQYCLTPSLFSSLIKSFLFALDVLITRYVFQVKLVWTIHNLRHHDPRPRTLERWTSIFFAANCTKVRLLGKGMEEVISNHFKIPAEKLVVIPEGPYIGWYPEGESRESARNKLDIQPDEVVWLYLGTLRPYKGVEDVMEAFDTFKGNEKLRLVIAGNPWNKAYSDALKEKAKGNTNIRIFANSVPDNELQTFFGAADLVVLPYKNVLNSGSALLAMGFGKAVVAPKKGLIPFRLNQQPELLFDDAHPLVSVLEKAQHLGSEELKQIGEKNRKEALRYNWDDFAQFILNV